MTEYAKIFKTNEIPRLPLEGSLDITYRCNNTCRHCWISIPEDSPEKREELAFDEIRKIVDDARQMGCRRWAISGGEPMLRPDFTEIFDYITRKSAAYSINTNGTLITPEIASRLKRKGSKMVSLYGATAGVHDRITRTPGSFDAAMQGIAYLKEAGAGFIVQLVPMRDNYHQFEKMISLAKTLSPAYRVGATWLYLSASGDPGRNQEIMRQRIDPEDVISLDTPDMSALQSPGTTDDRRNCDTVKNNRLFSSCITSRRNFHIDPYGHMTFCSLIKDPALRYDLKTGSFENCWETFIPSLSDFVGETDAYDDANCASCDLRNDCRWCPVYGYLEHRQYPARVEYLCDVARENRRFKEHWKKNHRRFYQIAGITIRVDSDLAITDDTFLPKFRHFEVDGPGEDTICIRHHFHLPELENHDLGQEVYRQAPWAIYRKGDAWIYKNINSVFSPSGNRSRRIFQRFANSRIYRALFRKAPDERPLKVAIFDHDHSRARIHNRDETLFRAGGMHALTLFSTDQILIARVLADRQGCCLHSSGVNLNGRGLLFAGHSAAGKSTMAALLKDDAEILCDDRIIVRRWPDGFKIHGTWSNGDVPDVSAGAAPLAAILFLEKDSENSILPLKDKKESIQNLLSCLVKPFVTNDWWENTLALAESIADEIPCYRLRFDRTGQVVDLLKHL